MYRILYCQISLKTSDKWQWHLSEYKRERIGYLTEQICQLQGSSKRRSLFYNKSMLLWTRRDSKKGAIFVTFDGEKWGKIDHNNIRWHMLLLTSLATSWLSEWGILKAMFIKKYDNAKCLEWNMNKYFFKSVWKVMW